MPFAWRWETAETISAAYRRAKSSLQEMLNTNQHYVARTSTNNTTEIGNKTNHTWKALDDKVKEKVPSINEIKHKVQSVFCLHKIDYFMFFLCYKLNALQH